MDGLLISGEPIFEDYRQITESHNSLAGLDYLRAKCFP